MRRRVPARCRRWRRIPAWLLAALFALLVGLQPFSPAARAGREQAQPPPPTSYELAQKAPFNRPDHYPLDRMPDPGLYRPHADWIGRLILPGVAETLALPGDWVWVEIEQAPAERSDLIGRRLRLGWQRSPIVDDLVGTVTTDVRLGSTAHGVALQGNLVPERLNGRSRVGPLQSLAGARPNDDVTVTLEDVLVEEAEAPQGRGPWVPTLRLGRPPVQITGRWSGLVQILGADPDRPPGEDRYRARHYNPGSGTFDGPLESIRLPRQPPDRHGRRPFEPEGVPGHPIGRDGWWIHGSPDRAGVFTVQALEPRRLFRLASDRRIAGREESLRWISQENWKIGADGRGTFERVALGDQDWRLGDHAVVLHNFGGIGGPAGETITGFTVTGHFAFGQAQLVADPFTGEPRFSLRYHQIYANNPNGIVSGSQDWSAYSGDLQRGWLGTRPISDVLVKADAQLAPELARQAQVIMARYRTGDGTGVATVTPATSCVQDSNQALWIAIDQLRRRLGPAAADSAAGEDSLRARRLAGLARELDSLLTPFGMVRDDWRSNSERVSAALAGIPTPGTGTGTGSSDGFQRGQSVGDVLLSWRSMMPRRAHDDLARLFARRDVPIRILRTNQIPGANPALEPLAPTLVLGQVPVLSTLLQRITDALFAPIRPGDAALGLLLLVGYGAVVIPTGLRAGFLTPTWRAQPQDRWWIRAPMLLVMPALVEELIFRVALLPHPHEGVSAGSLVAWSVLSTGLFVGYHPLAARLWYPRARRIFDDGRFLLPCALLGVVTVIAYVSSGSLWPPVLLHWLAVLAWLRFLGGAPLLEPAAARRPPGAQGTQG